MIARVGSPFRVQQLLDRRAQLVGYGRRSARIHIEVDAGLHKDGDLYSVAAGHAVRQTQGRIAEMRDRRCDVDDVSHTGPSELSQVEFEG